MKRTYSEALAPFLIDDVIESTILPYLGSTLLIEFYHRIRKKTLEVSFELSNLHQSEGSCPRHYFIATALSDETAELMSEWLNTYHCFHQFVLISDHKHPGDFQLPFFFQVYDPKNRRIPLYEELDDDDRRVAIDQRHDN